MGFKRSYKCPGCNYSVITSAGPDLGGGSSTNTFVCKTCQIIVDKAISSSNPLLIKPSFPDGLAEWLKEAMEEGAEVNNPGNENQLQPANPPTPRKRKKKVGANICSTCESTELEVWDCKKMPCPKCGTKLIIDPSGIRMNWDFFGDPSS